jgi:hypothetical protein
MVHSRTVEERSVAIFTIKDIKELRELRLNVLNPFIP